MTLVRHPEFHVPTQTWHWWSSPDAFSSWSDDAAQAQAIEVRWTVEKDGQGGRRWDGRFEALPGFAPFLWSVVDGHLWLRRPEGVWKTTLPKMRPRDYVSLKEQCDGLTSGYRGGFLVSPELVGLGWKMGDGVITLDEHDASMFATVMVDEKPMLDNYRAFTSRRDPITTVHLPQWSEPGPLRFRRGQGIFLGVPQEALVIVLPNGVEVAEPMNRDMLLPFMIKRSKAVATMGDDIWMPRHEQTITLDVSADVSV